MIFSAVFLISAVLFALEVLQTRIFSFSSWHHMTYMVVAIALMGYAAAGMVLAVKKGLKNYEKFIHVISVLFVFSIPVAFFMTPGLPLDPMIPNKLFMIIVLFTDYLFLSLPHFFGGLILLAVFQNNSKNVNISYFFSISGSVAGCFSALPLLDAFGMETALVTASFLAALSSFFISFAAKRRLPGKVFSALLMVFALVLFPIKNSVFVFRPAISKILTSVGADPEMSEWNRAGRVDISATNGLVIQHQWEDLQRGMITIDGDAASFIFDFSDEPARVAPSLYSAGYFGLFAPDVFVAGLSTTDIAAALFWQAKSVTTVEVNSAVIDLTMRKYSTFKNNILKNDKVAVLHDEVRSFLEKTDKKYDLIQLSGTDTVSALMNGAYLMNESYLYTKEAFRTYIDRLNDDGTLALIRWVLWPPRETLRVAVTASLALKEAGFEHPENNIIIIGDSALASVVVKKRPFTWTELNAIAEIVAGTKDLRIIYAPGFSAGARYYDPIVKGVNFSSDQAIDFIKSGFVYYFRSLENGTQDMFIDDYPYNIKPVSDDSPFFFNYFKFGGEKLSKEVRTVFFDASRYRLIILGLTFVQLLFLSLSLFVSPLFFMSKEEKKYLPLVQLLVFAALGFGFMFIELTFIQNLTLLFGDPATSAATAIGLLLVLSAIGSLFSKKILISLGEKPFFSSLAIILPLMILGYAVFFPYFSAACMGLSFTLKLLLTALVIAPLGFLTGTVFPVSALLVGEKNSSFVPLAFGANGAASVLASVVSVIVAMVYGFKFVFLMSAFCYFFALSAMLYFVKRRV
ncbi:hypothetical protein J6253_00915 [bacterium]|nr:hypothetical protein [bacterium]